MSPSQIFPKRPVRFLHLRNVFSKNLAFRTFYFQFEFVLGYAYFRVSIYAIFWSFEKLTKDSWDAIHQKIFCSDFILVSFPGRIGRYLIGPFNAGPFLTPAPLTPALIPIRAGVKRATNFSKSGIKRVAFLKGQCKKVHHKKLVWFGPT